MIDKIVEKDGRPQRVWARPDNPMVKAGDEVDALWLRSEKLTAKAGDEFFLIYDLKLRIWCACDLTIAQHEVISKAPDTGDGWLLYWYPHRESQDPVFKEIAKFAFEHGSFNSLAALSKQVPVEQIRAGFDRSKGKELGGYAIMLGVTGDQSDSARFEKAIRRAWAVEAEGKTYETSLEPFYFGYLQANSESAAKLIEDEALKGDLSKRYGVPGGVVASLILENSRLPRGRGLGILHRILDDPDLDDDVVSYLRRLEDWTQSTKLGELWDQPGERPDLGLRRAIISYLFAAEKKGTAAESKQATEVLSKLRTRDAAGVEKTTDDIKKLYPELIAD